MKSLFTVDLVLCLFCSKIITIDEAKRRQSFGSCDGDGESVDVLPILNDTSDLLQDTHIEKVTFHLNQTT